MSILHLAMSVSFVVSMFSIFVPSWRRPRALTGPRLSATPARVRGCVLEVSGRRPNKRVRTSMQVGRHRPGSEWGKSATPCHGLSSPLSKKQSFRECREEGALKFDNAKKHRKKIADTYHTGAGPELISLAL